MDHVGLEELVKAGEGFLVAKYFNQAAMTVAVWDHLTTLSDEVEYVWKKEKLWPFWVFIVSRYSILVYETWVMITLFFPSYTQEVCNRTVKLEGYYFVFLVAFGHIFLTMRIYALAEASKYVLLVFGILVTSSAATGVWLVSMPSAAAIQMPKIPLDPFQSCNFVTPKILGWAYRMQVALADLIAFACIVVFISKLKAGNGQSRMTRLMRTILQDGILYFFVLVGYQIAKLFVTVYAGPSVRNLPNLPLVAIIALIPVMISRLVISLRKAVDTSIFRVWDRDHFTAAEISIHEMVDLANPLSLPGSRPLSSHQDLTVLP